MTRRHWHARPWYWHPAVRRPMQALAYGTACTTIAAALWWLHDNVGTC